MIGCRVPGCLDVPAIYVDDRGVMYNSTFVPSRLLADVLEVVFAAEEVILLVPASLCEVDHRRLARCNSDTSQLLLEIVKSVVASLRFETGRILNAAYFSVVEYAVVFLTPGVGAFVDDYVHDERDKVLLLVGPFAPSDGSIRGGITGGDRDSIDDCAFDRSRDEFATSKYRVGRVSQDADTGNGLPPVGSWVSHVKVSDGARRLSLLMHADMLDILIMWHQRSAPIGRV